MIIRMAMFLCKVEGISRRVKLCPSCHATLREFIIDSWKLASRSSCDACTKRSGR